MSSDAVSEALEPMRKMLNADGYDVLAEYRGGTLIVRLIAGPDACEDCLAPDSVLRPMVSQMLSDASIEVAQWELEYPSEVTSKPS